MASFLPADPGSLGAAEYDAQIAETLTALQNQWASLKKTTDALAAERDKVPELEEAHKQAALTSVAAEEAIAAHEAAAKEAVAAEAAARAALAGLEADLPQGVRSKAALEDKLQQIRRRSEALKKALETAQSAVDGGRRREAGATARKDAAAGLVVEAELQEVDARQDFLATVTKAGFANPADYRAACLAESAVSELEDAIASYQEEVRSAGDNLERLTTETEGLALRDPDALQRELDTIQEQKNERIGARTGVVSRAAHNLVMVGDIRAISRDMTDREQEYAVLGDLANTAKGHNSQRISFERYVLAAFFNDIIDAANIRLKKMTGGRYEMNRIAGRGKGAAQTGLEIEVLDYYTGRTRHVKTLSGGESFKASLALALGLADVVQSYAGGVNLETMFVDEGFGTLDPESLDSAIQCLVDLRDSGRLVGIISHVPELRTSIDAQLEVEAGRGGSRTRFVVA